MPLNSSLLLGEKSDPLRQFGRGGEGLGGEDSVAAIFAN